MSGFAPDWLRLREPLDERARSVELTWAFGRAMAMGPALVDLGAGTGSNLRQLCLRLGHAAQDWTLIEKDMRLLAHAPREIGQWAERSGWTVGEERMALRLRCDGLDVRAEMRSYDLARDLTGLGLDRYDGVTASALFDLVSGSWIDRFAAELAGCGLPPVLVTLTVDGRVDFDPSHADDGFVLERFHAHMERDKGFGPALGPAAPAALARALADAGYRVTTARSDWRLADGQRAVQRALIDGYAEAAAAQDPAAAERIAAWAADRRAWQQAGSGRLMVGHMDILGLR